MRPEVRRSLVLGAGLAVLLSGAALWAARLSQPGAENTATAGTPVAVVVVPTGTAVASSHTALVANPAYLPMIIKPPPTPTPSPTATPVPVTPPAAGDWRTWLGYYRAVAHLPIPAENVDWSSGAVAHACYIVENQALATGEDAGSACYSPHGQAAAQNSLLLLKGEANFGDRQALDQWMQWPFHALAILDPRLQATGFGRYQDQSPPLGTFRTGAVLDVKRGLGSVPAGTHYPIRWPDQNTTVYLTGYDGSEQPDPLTSCGGFPLGSGSGLPISLQLGPGDVTPAVTAHSLKRGSTSLAHCIFDETNYNNSVASLQQLGRALLGQRDAIILIPRDPLLAGNTYQVSITTGGTTYAWSFSVRPP